jgi:glycosyltransferase involved in cell wall biosynthesis
MPLVTVIVPFFNEARFIRETVESVLAQQQQPVELLLVDDGSSDESTAIARGYAERFLGRVRSLEHPGHANRGRSATRNRGLAEARGELVTFLDADDVWLPGKLEAQVAILDGHPEAGFVCGPTEWWWSWAGEGAAEADRVQDLGLPLDRVAEPPTLLRNYLRNEWAVLHDLVVRRALVERVGGWEDRFPGMFDDQAFHAKLSLASPGFVSAACTTRYRQHPASCTAQAHALGEHRAARRAFLEWLDGYLAEHASWGSPVRRDVRSELLRLRHPAAARVVGAGCGVGRRIRTALHP